MSFYLITAHESSDAADGDGDDDGDDGDGDYYYYYYYQCTDLSDAVTRTMQGHFTES